MQAESHSPTWSQDASSGWARSVDYRERMLEDVGRELLESAHLCEGQRVAEIGSGAGALARMASLLVGETGLIVGVDVSSELNAMASARAAGMTNLRFVTADAQTVELPDCPFDCVLSRFGVMFFADPEVALVHLHSLLRSGGGLHIAVWDSIELNPWADVVIGVCRRHLVLPPRRAVPTGAFSLSDPAQLRQMLDCAGFRHTRFRSWRGAVDVGQPGQALTDVALALLPPGLVTARYQELAVDKQRRLIEEIAAELACFESPQGVRMPAAAYIVSAVA